MFYEGEQGDYGSNADSLNGFDFALMGEDDEGGQVDTAYVRIGDMQTFSKSRRFFVG